ncbi:polyadenylate-binding protein 6 isoform X1 [Ziziphus jujuba]|uniref:Polyadenylate-binding protein 6 isoform X1 n=1 Tax=Ziziphus jujuba TaxID=326968 RepID=A0ABM3IM49_ZIZJJ|nr:polyadenylate-binding protein 6 isoform X1 [Ziziphus jujuba]
MVIQYMFGVPVRVTESKPAPPADNRIWSLGDLDPQVTEADLLDAFRLIGPIASLRLCRDSFTGESLRYAYVNFFTSLHASICEILLCKMGFDSSFLELRMNLLLVLQELIASTALTFLNHKELKGQSMRIMWSQRYPLTRKMGIANLFVKNLHPSFTSGQLQSMFSKFGRILSCKVASENGNSKGFGFVQFDSKLSAMTARNALHGTLLKGKKIYVSKFVKKSERTVANGETMKASLQGQNKQLFIARAQQEEIVNCHTEKLKASSLPEKNSTHPVHCSSFYSLGKDLMKQRQQINTGKQSFKSESSVCGNNFVQDT